MKRIMFLLITGFLFSGCVFSNTGKTPDNNPFTTPVTVLPPAYTPAPENAIPTPTALPTPTPLPQARIANADHALFNGDWISALQAYRAALDNSSEPDVRAAALLGSGKTLFLMGAYAEALDTLREVRETYPDSPQSTEALFYLARTYQALGRHEEAATAYAQYAPLAPNGIQSYLYEWSGDAWMQAEEYEAAIQAYWQALQAPRAGSREAEQSKLAAAYTQNGRYDDALGMYEQIFQQTGNDYTRAQVLFLSGNIYRILGNDDEAFARYLQAVESYPRAYDSYSALVELVNAGYAVDELQRGLVDYYAGQDGVALAAFERYINAPGDLNGKAKARYYRGLILRSRGAYQQALDSWRWIVEHTPESPYWADAWEEIGYTQWAYLDDYEAAIETFLGFVDAAPAAPRAPEFYDSAARVAERSGDLTRAASLWESLAEAYPKSTYAPRALFQAGIAYYRSGQFPQAQAGFLRAYNNSADSEQRAAALLWLGKVQQAIGDSAGAQTYWQQATQEDPTGYYSERARDLLLQRPPFSPPQVYDLSFDYRAERSEAENWLRATFGLPAETDLSSPGSLASDPRWMRGVQLWHLGMYEQARLEFENLRLDVQDNPADSYRLGNALIELGAFRSGIYAMRQVLTLAGMSDADTMFAPRYFNHLRFGAYYADLLVPAAQENGFHPLFLFSLTRQESLFEGFVHSSAGARGLMQIIPSTGTHIADLLGWPPQYTDDDLYRPLVNVRFGAAYLARQRDAFHGDLYAALAAYNAGPGNASIWYNLSGGDPDLFLEIIRYPETQEYIRGIYEMYAIYYRLYDRSP